MKNWKNLKEFVSFKKISENQGIVMLIILSLFMISWAVSDFYEIKDAECDMKVFEYRRSLPNWDDTIVILMKNNPELQRAIKERDKQKLKIQRFRDSLYAHR